MQYPIFQKINYLILHKNPYLKVNPLIKLGINMEYKNLLYNKIIVIKKAVHKII